MSYFNNSNNNKTMFKIFDKVIAFISKAKGNWKVKLAVGDQTLAEV